MLTTKSLVLLGARSAGRARGARLAFNIHLFEVVVTYRTVITGVEFFKNSVFLERGIPASDE